MLSANHYNADYASLAQKFEKLIDEIKKLAPKIIFTAGINVSKPPIRVPEFMLDKNHVNLSQIKTRILEVFPEAEIEEEEVCPVMTFY